MKTKKKITLIIVSILSFILIGITLMGCGVATMVGGFFIGRRLVMNKKDEIKATNFSFEYDATTDSYIVTEYKGSDSVVVIPSTYKNKRVSFIGVSAFEDCNNLTSITIPDSIIEIPYNTFGNCTNLSEITLPFVGAVNGETSNSHFGYIFGANSSSSNNDYIPKTLKKVTITSAKDIGDWAFYNCDTLTEIVLGDGVTNIGNYSFKSCSYLTKIVIPDSVKTISDWAFYNCWNLTEITIPCNTTNIGAYAFSYCSNLTKIIIPDSTKNIGAFSFLDCYKLTIYCQSTNTLNEWNTDWNYSNCPVVWGYTGE